MTDIENIDVNPQKREPVSVKSFERHAIAKKILTLAAQFWFLVAVIRQWIFGFYYATHYSLTP